MLEDRKLDKSIPMPLYYQLKTILLEEMDKGNYPVGGMIPTEKDLSEMFEISRTTVRQAIAELVQEGKLYRVKSKGTFVSKPKISPQFITQRMRFDEHILSSGRTSQLEILAMEVVPMPEHLVQLGVGAAGSQAVYLYRRRLADNMPVMRTLSYLPHDLCGFLFHSGFDFNEITIHDALESRNATHIHRITRAIEAVPAGPEDVRVLNVELGTPIQKVTAVRYNREGQIIDYSNAFYRGDQLCIHFEMTEEG